MHAIWFMLTALAVLAVGYRYYSAFLAARVLVLADERATPAHTCNDGQNFHPTNKWVLFGHHFAAISGAGPLIGPVLAAQFGFLPGYTWILFGVVLGGAVHDFVILVASVRRRGRSLAELAKDELGPVLGFVAALAILFIVVIALAGMGHAVVGALAESSWGVFTIGASVPIALAMGVYIYKVRGGTLAGIREATLAGVVLLVLALVYGKHVQDGPLSAAFRLDRTTLTLAIGGYGFVASVLPVWMLLCPRDYLSSYLKIGTIAVLVLGILVVNPRIEMPMLNHVDASAVHVAGEAFAPIVKGKLFPFVFITIACGAISGFHALVASGTTPKMIDKESDCRSIGYGAMLMEGLVGITALLAATALSPRDYFAINTDRPIAAVATARTDHHGLARSEGDLRSAAPFLSAADRELLGLRPDQDPADLADHTLKASTVLHLSNRALWALGYRLDPDAPMASELDEADFLRLGIPVMELPALAKDSNEVIAARTGGAVSLAIGMSRVFSGLPGMKSLLAYWYHFAIMFEALFVLTTIDTGTRVGRFLLQELAGRFSAKAGDTSWTPGAIVSSAVIVAGFSFFILTGSIGTIWPMFGIANQLLAVTALAIGTTILLREAKQPKYALVTFAPLVFVAGTTLTAGVESIALLYVPMAKSLDDRLHFTGVVNVIVTGALLAGVVAILVGSAIRWVALLRRRPALELAA